MKPNERRKPVIGITVHQVRQPSPGGRPTDFLRVAAQYARAIREAGGLPLLLPADPGCAARPQETIHAVDGLLFSGGKDLPPGLFEAARAPTLRSADPPRYDYEVELVRAARAAGLPMMGICRGHQTMAEALGGSLLPNIAAADCQYLGHYQQLPAPAASHEVATVAGSMLGQWLGPGASVNSFHRQAVDRVPPGFREAARSSDGVLEAMECEAPFALGIQFHPEWLFEGEPLFLKIFQALVHQAARASARRHPDDGSSCRGPLDTPPTNLQGER